MGANSDVQNVSVRSEFGLFGGEFGYSRSKHSPEHEDSLIYHRYTSALLASGIVTFVFLSKLAKKHIQI